MKSTGGGGGARPTFQGLKTRFWYLLGRCGTFKGIKPKKKATGDNVLF